jgi:oxalate decarboxylase/phosphoglucose isomerase-like protein (cupin superfamily)
MDDKAKFYWNPYLVWQKAQGIPIHTGFFVEDARKVPVEFWQARNANGAFINLAAAQFNDAYVLEIPPRERTTPRRQLFDEITIVIGGQGATTLWYDEHNKKSFEWQEGSTFAIPPNVWYQHHAMNVNTRLLSVTSAPLYMQLFNNDDFIFSNDFEFSERYSGATNFSQQDIGFRDGLTRGIETNLISDIRQFYTRDRFEELKRKGNFPDVQRAYDSYNLRVRFARSMMLVHLSSWGVGTYKKAHRHGPDFSIMILDGEGYSLLWQENKARERIDWHAYSLFVPPIMWFHQHFNAGAEPIRFIAFHPPGLLAYPGWSGEGKEYTGKGPNQIEYEDEDPEIRKIFEEELSKRGVTSRMPSKIYERQQNLVEDGV